MALVRPTVRGRSWRCLSAAVEKGEGPGLPTAPDRYPIVGHALNFKPPKMLDYMLETAAKMDTWAWRYELGTRRPAVVGDPAMAQAICKPNSGWGGRSAATLPFVLDSSEAIVGNKLAQGVGFANGPVHHAPARKVAADGLLKQSFVSESEATIARKTNELCEILRRTSGAPVDMQVQYARCALDIVGALAFKTEVGALRDEATELEVCLSQFFRGIGENIGTLFPFWRYLPEGTPNRYTRYVRNAKRIIELVAPIVAERRAFLDGGGESQCFVDAFLAEDTPYDDTEIVWHAIQILAAGYDTTSNTLAFTSLILAGKPRLQAELRAEIIAVAPTGDITADHVAEMPLLNNVLKESMRLYPAAPIFGRLYERDEPWEYDGEVFEKDASCMVVPYLLGRNPHAWGDDVLDFNPERFANGQRAGNAKHTYAWLPFGFGARGCVGMKLALIEAKLILAGTVRDFQMDLAPGQSPDPDPVLALTLSNNGGVNLDLTPL